MTSPTERLFGDVLRKPRLSPQLTQAELDERAGLSIRGINASDKGGMKYSMMTDHLRKVMEQLAEQPEEVQEKYATEIEVDLDVQEQARIAAQLADPQQTDLDEFLARAKQQVATGQTYDLEELLDTIQEDDTDA